VTDPTESSQPLNLKSGIAVFFLGFTFLMYELFITRVFSAIFSYHFSFMAVSLALFGLGTSGLYYQKLARKGLSAEDYFRSLDRWGSLFSMSILMFLCAAFLVPLPFYSALPHWLCLIGMFMLASLPFFSGGLMICSLLDRYREHSGQVYSYDLLGGAFACILTISVMNSFGPSNGLLLLCLLAALAGSILATQGGIAKPKSVWIALFTILLLVINISTNLIRMRYVYSGSFKNTVPVETDFWNAFSRISVVQGVTNRSVPFYRIVIDTGADTWVFPVSQEPWYPSLVAFSLRPGGDFVILGSGGGSDLRCALRNSPRHVDCVEINPIMIDLVKGPLAEFCGDPYKKPNVDVFVQDGRSFMERTDKKYDVCVLTLVDTYASVSTGAYALTENNLYTMESLNAYLSRLKPGGVLSIARWGFENVRLLAMLREALKKQGISDPERHVFIFGPHNLKILSILVKNTPFTDEEISRMESMVNKRGFTIYYKPGNSKSDSVLDYIVGNGSLDALYRSVSLDISPSTDDRPFFFQHWKLFRTAPDPSLDRLKLPWADPPLTALKDLGKESPEGVKAPRVVLCLLLLISFVISLGFVGGALVSLSGLKGKAVKSLYFAMLGIGFMVIEICLAQSFILFLGHPVYAVSATIFALLISGAAGSALTERISGSALRRGQIIAAAVVIAAVVSLALLRPLVVIHFFAAPLVVRALLAVLLIAPLGIAMGMPFPLGLRRLVGASSGTVPWMWAINGSTSVLGSVLAVMCAIFFGFKATLFLGALCYAVALLLALADRSGVEH